jgi:predicted dehydrogenase
LVAAGKLADAVVIATPDALHREPCLRFAEKGWHMLVEKPLALAEEDCRRIVAAVKSAGVVMAVAHVLRYTAHTQQLKTLLKNGVLGEIVSIQHLEPVGFWHQAHSFVRGNWRNSRESTFMLLAKSCHDLDWLRYVMDQPCRAVCSFGSLFHFKKENRPAKAADRCLDCPVAAQCAYDAQRIYLGRFDAGQRHWPLDVLAPEVTRESLLQALRHGPYGRCVYACDNDVVDHQVVNLQFANGSTAVFTMTAFTESAPRQTQIFGTRGHLTTDGQEIRVYDFTTGQTAVHEPHAGPGGHSGGDFALLKTFLEAVRSGDVSSIVSGPRETLESHSLVFAAERSRLEGRVEQL